MRIIEIDYEQILNLNQNIAEEIIATLLVEGQVMLKCKTDKCMECDGDGWIYTHPSIESEIIKCPKCKIELD